MGKNRSRIKGYKFENWCIKELRKAGLNVERLGQPNQPDLVVDGFGTAECKCYSKGLKSIYKYLGDNKALVVKWQSRSARGKEPLVIIRWDDFKELLIARNIA